MLHDSKYKWMKCSGQFWNKLSTCSKKKVKKKIQKLMSFWWIIQSMEKRKKYRAEPILKTVDK